MELYGLEAKYIKKSLRPFLKPRPNGQVVIIRFTNPNDEYFDREGIIRGVTPTGKRLLIQIIAPDLPRVRIVSRVARNIVEVP